MKPLPLAAAAVLLLAAPVAAQAQVAAGSVPNTFDQPAARPAAPAAAPAANPEGPVEPAHPRSEAVLRTIIDQIARGEIDYDLMTEDMAAAMRPQAATVTPLVEGFGPLQSVRLAGTERGIDGYEVLFARAATIWLIGLNHDGVITALRFRPVETAPAGE